MTRFAKPKEQQVERENLDAALRILAIDDAPSVINVIASGLEAYGHTVLTASSGLRGLEIFNDYSVDVVLCDLSMPGMNGWDVGKAILKICHEKGIRKSPFIIVTACSRRISDDSPFVESGVEAIVGKPVEFGELLAVISKTLRQPIPEYLPGRNGALSNVGNRNGL